METKDQFVCLMKRKSAHLKRSESSVELLFVTKTRKELLICSGDPLFQCLHLQVRVRFDVTRGSKKERASKVGLSSSDELPPSYIPTVRPRDRSGAQRSRSRSALHELIGR